ncbi:MAG: hypothetical protein KDG52_07175 [Rhodocyclaceae bacterium]|nr:hypothetical protein [Rhodocyclaceae bacterium]
MFAVAELRAGETIGEDALKAFCREPMAGFRIPKRCCVSELPKSAIGKIPKSVPREKAHSSEAFDRKRAVRIRGRWWVPRGAAPGPRGTPRGAPPDNTRRHRR